MKDSARVLTTWALILLTVLWSVGVDECLGVIDCCSATESPTAASDTSGASGGCCATKPKRDDVSPASTLEHCPQGRGDASPEVCACQDRSSAPAPVEIVAATSPVQSVLPPPASRTLSANVPRSALPSSVWSPLKARAPPGATGLS